MYKVTPALAPAVYVPGLMFEALIRVRNRLYGAAVFPCRRLPAPVISVGNITMGGSGKTPLVIYIARMLSGFGLSPGILTRGYRRIRSGDTHILAPEETVFSPAWILGDEPALMRRYLPFSWMGVSKDRFAAGMILASRNKQMIFVLDDGFQHRKLHRDLDIVVIDRSQPLASNRIFPRGTLREPLAGLCRCDIIIINGSKDSVEHDSIEAEIENLKTGARVFTCRQSIGCLIPFSSWQTAEGKIAGEMPMPSQKRPDVGATGRSPAVPGTSPDDLYLERANCRSPLQGSEAPKPTLPSTAYLVSALGNPERFRRDVRQLGIEIAGTKFFPDHYRFKMGDWQNCIEAARHEGAEAMITTEKDAVKIGRPPDFPLLVAVQSTEIFDVGEFELLLRKVVKERT